MTPNAEDAPHRAHQGKCFTPEPIQTRSAASKSSDDAQTHTASTNANEPEGRPQRPLASAAAAMMWCNSAPVWGTVPPSAKTSSEERQHKETLPKLESRPYCTQACLIGLTQGRPLDHSCPNVKDHGATHIDVGTFRRLVRCQLATDRGADADCAPLPLPSSRGTFFKLRLLNYGYTLIAKGMEDKNRAFVEHEGEVYNHLQPIQGKYIPVCLGNLALALPWYHNNRSFCHLLLLSWGGDSLFDCVRDMTRATILSRACESLGQIHQLGVMHREGEMSNMTYNSQTDTIMIVDFERAKLPNPKLLACFGLGPSGEVSAGGKRKREELPRERALEFLGEYEQVTRWLRLEITEAQTFRFGRFVKSLPSV